MSSKPAKRLYEFGSFIVDAAEGLLLRDGQPIPLTPKAFETLIALVENSGHVLGKDELMRRVWPDSFVEENNLSQNISILRKALGEGAAGGQKYIETVPKRGYRFVAGVTELRDERAAEVEKAAKAPAVIVAEHSPGVDEIRAPVFELPKGSASAPARGREFNRDLQLPPETKYARSGDFNIAYQVIGDAPLDLVFVMGWVSHLEYFWSEPSFARFLRRLASFSRLILFDKRGTGLSDRVPVNELPTLEQRMDDVRAVLDAVG
ncbi:MAG: winged helix-turn-helix domain-containing protein, partial [Pyrinomonadaceae bacterium]